MKEFEISAWMKIWVKYPFEENRLLDRPLPSNNINLKNRFIRRYEKGEIENVLLCNDTFYWGILSRSR